MKVETQHVTAQPAQIRTAIIRNHVAILGNIHLQWSDERMCSRRIPRNDRTSDSMYVPNCSWRRSTKTQTIWTSVISTHLLRFVKVYCRRIRHVDPHRPGRLTNQKGRFLKCGIREKASSIGLSCGTLVRNTAASRGTSRSTFAVCTTQSPLNASLNASHRSHINKARAQERYTCQTLYPERGRRTETSK